MSSLLAVTKASAVFSVLMCQNQALSPIFLEQWSGHSFSPYKNQKTCFKVIFTITKGIHFIGTAPSNQPPEPHGKIRLKNYKVYARCEDTDDPAEHRQRI